MIATPDTGYRIPDTGYLMPLIISSKTAFYTISDKPVFSDSYSGPGSDTEFFSYFLHF